jgi:acyl carrier protein
VLSVERCIQFGINSTSRARAIGDRRTLQYRGRLLKLHAIVRRKERAALEPVKTRSLDEIKQELKQLLVQNLSLEELKPEDIKDDMNLFGEGGVGLDSLDGVEVVVLLRRQYGLDVMAMQKGRDIFRTINTLAPFVLAHATK